VEKEIEKNETKTNYPDCEFIVILRTLWHGTLASRFNMAKTQSPIEFRVKKS
jgi:hypothetical protein